VQQCGGSSGDDGGTPGTEADGGSVCGAGSVQADCEDFLNPVGDQVRTFASQIDARDVLTLVNPQPTDDEVAQFNQGVQDALAHATPTYNPPSSEIAELKAVSRQCGMCSHSPLVLDLDGTGIAASALEDGVLFDLFAEGRLMRTSWPLSGALLALDRDGNGQIDNGLELFGNTSDAPDGFARLAELDANHDGVIDAKDPVYKKLVLWRDRNRDGKSQRSELSTLSSEGVLRINLAYTKSDSLDGQGNRIGAIGTFVRRTPKGKVQGTVGDIWFHFRSVSAAGDVANVCAALPPIRL
jgi:hypothetical protein